MVVVYDVNSSTAEAGRFFCEVKTSLDYKKPVYKRDAGRKRGRERDGLSHNTKQYV